MATKFLGCVALAFLSASVGAPAQDYGPVPTDKRFFQTQVYADGTNAWEKAAAAALAKRGFSPRQIAKVARVNIVVGSESTPRGRISTTEVTPPMKYNSETGEKMPSDPLAYAAAMPDCYKSDERNCTFVFSANFEPTVGGEEPCRVPQRTIFFCRRAGLQNVYVWGRDAEERAAGRGQYAPFCGEGSRGPECGAGQVVFDAQQEQTKLAFSTAQALSSAEPTPSPPPKIVYRTNNLLAFIRRDGPSNLEEWEYNVKNYIRNYELAAKRGSDTSDQGYARKDPTFAHAMRYCWPHDVFHPCGVY